MRWNIPESYDTLVRMLRVGTWATVGVVVLLALLMQSLGTLPEAPPPPVTGIVVSRYPQATLVAETTSDTHATLIMTSLDAPEVIRGWYGSTLDDPWIRDMSPPLTLTHYQDRACYRFTVTITLTPAAHLVEQTVRRAKRTGSRACP